MKIDKVIFSCDDNGDYRKMWELTSKICKLTLGVTPVLFHLTNEYSDFYHDEYGIIKKIKASPNIPTSFQSQLYRLYGSRYFMDDNIMMSDIDMLSFNREYFFKQIEDVNENSLVIYESDAYDLSREDCQNMYALNRYPMCYVLGKGSTFIKILDINCDFDEFCEKVHDFNFGYDLPIFHRDECYIGKKINKNLNEIDIVKLKRGIENVWNYPRRINKDDYQHVNYDLISNKTYIDFHLPNDYLNNLEIIDKITNSILVHY
jgi:hypothetical protein